MRNLKRALSLALASVMLLGMMVVGTSAASYADVSSKNNLEAIEVLKMVGIMTGADRDWSWTSRWRCRRKNCGPIWKNGA